VQACSDADAWPLLHSNSIILRHRNALNLRRRSFWAGGKDRHAEPSEIRAFDSKHEFRRPAICLVSAIIGVGGIAKKDRQSRRLADARGKKSTGADKHAFPH
jgi:hypothetical protein